MSFKGDVDHIPLSNILQALALNGQEGILTIEAATYQRRLRILSNGLRLLNFTDSPPDALRSILLKEKLLTDSQFQNTFSSWVPGSCYPGEFLISRRILTPEIITTRVLHQIESTILEIVVTPNVKYEFTANADATPYEMFNPEALGNELVLSTNAVLMEALRRDDEMRRISEVIQSPNEIFTVPAKRGISTKDLEVNVDFLREIRPLLNGEHSVARIVTLTTLSTFEVYQTLHALHKKGIIRPLTIDEKRQLAEKQRKSLRAEDAISTLRSILLSEPTDQTTRLKLVSLLEKSKDDASDLAEQYFQLSVPIAESDPSRATSYLQRGLERAPYHLGILERLFELHHRAGDHKSAVAIARSVSVTAKNSESAPQAIALLYKIINFYPQEPILFHELADVHLHARDSDSALSCLKTVADLYERVGDQHNLRKTYELITRLNPSEGTKLKRIVVRARRAPINFRRLLFRACMLLVLTAVLGLLALVGVTEYRSRLTFAQVLSDVTVHKSNGDLAGARELLKDFEKSYPFSSRLKQLHLELAEVNKLYKKRQEDERVVAQRKKLQAESNYVKAKLALEGNEYIKADELLRDMDKQLLDPERARDATRMASTVATYFGRAREILGSADAAEAANDFELCHKLKRELVTRYPYSPSAAGILLPVRLESVPSEATVTVEGHVIGKTPILLRLPPNKLPVIRINRPGYNEFVFTPQSMSASKLSVLESHRLSVTMTKTTEWTYQGEGSIEGFPAIVDALVHFGTRNGVIYAINILNGQHVWKYTTQDNMDVSGGICSWRNLIYFGSFDGRLYVLDSQSGKPAYPPIMLTAEKLPVKTAPSQPSESGVVALNCDNKYIATCNLTSGKPGWSLSSAGAQFLGQPQAVAGKLFVVTTRGELFELAHDTGQVLNRTQLGHELVVRGRLAGSSYYFTTPTGKLVNYSLTSRVPLWSYDCGEQIGSPPIVEGEWVIAMCSSGKLHCLNSSGEIKWVSTGGEGFAPGADGTVIRNQLLVGTSSGVIECFDLWSGALLWSYKAGGKAEKSPRGILAAGAVSKGKFVIGSEDNTLYCFSLD